MRNLHNILLQEDGIEAQCLFRLWEKLRLRASEYKNHRIFTLRCLQNDLIPVSIKLKSSLKVARANKILRKAQKELLQTRIKSINYILDNTSKQLEECRSQLAAIISTQRLKECQDFVDKVGEIRFNKVKLRQLNKFNLLTIRKEGNITRSNNTNTNNLTLQANSQVNQISSQAREEALLPGPPLLPGKVTVLPRQVLPLETLAPLWQPYRQTVRTGKEVLLPRLALSLPGKTTVFPRQVPLSLPGKLVPLRQLLSFQWKEIVLPRPLLSFHQWKATAHLIPLALPKQVKSAILPVLLGKAIGAPQGTGPPRPPRRSIPPPGKATLPPPFC